MSESDSSVPKDEILLKEPLRAINCLVLLLERGLFYLRACSCASVTLPMSNLVCIFCRVSSPYDTLLMVETLSDLNKRGVFCVRK